jgi:hypothetical protein
MWQIDTIKKYKKNNNVFVETGTWMGDGIDVALNLNFNLVYSCDIDKQNVIKAKQRFLNKNVKIFHNSSAEFLNKILSLIDEPAVIWLDAHVMPDASGKVFSENQLNLTNKLNISVCPIMDELNVIFEQSKHKNIILIDDYHCFNSWEFNHLSENTVKEYILSKNKTYNFSVEENILCCF